MLGQVSNQELESSKFHALTLSFLAMPTKYFKKTSTRPEKPNAGTPLLPEAEETQEHRLLASGAALG